MLRPTLAPFVIPLFGSVLASPAWSAPPLIVATEVVGNDIQVYLRSGELVLIQSTADGSTTSLRPLVHTSTSAIPPDLEMWTRLEPQRCSDAPRFQWSRANKTAEATVTGTWAKPTINIALDGVTVAEGLMGRPAQICAIHVMDVDPIPGEEVVVLWQTGRGPHADSGTTGVSVLRIPATAE